jgi:hypothetical protein
MLLREMFSPIGAPNSEQDEIDWLDDLKFFIDNDTNVLSHHFFPAIKKHHDYHNHADAYKFYIRPLERCKDIYCNQFKVDKPEEKFPKEQLIVLAKRIADEQNKFIEKGDYNK